jgi:transposase
MAIKRKRIIELLREGFSQADVASALRCSKRDVARVAQFLRDNELGDEALAKLTEDDLRQLTSTRAVSEDNYVKPDLDYICRELKRPGVTRKLLWYEYSTTTLPERKELYQYTQFCKLVEKHLVKSSATLRIKHKPGRCLFVDWAGDTMAVRDRITGRDIKVYLFVACLPYSGYTYVEGFLDLTQRSWITAHEHAFSFFGGVPFIIVPDQCATAVDRAPIYVTIINSTDLDFVEHHATATVPARKRKPQDKAAVEGAVGIVEQWIVAPLRKETFFALNELNEAVREKLAWINERPFSAKEGSRLSVFEDEEELLLRPANPDHFEQYLWKKPIVGHDYHVQIDFMRYSVDHHLIKEVVDARITDTTIDIFFKGELVASHRRLYGRKGQFSTVECHMPKNHRSFDSAWSPEGFIKWAKRIGPATEKVITTVLESRPIVEQAFVSCSNILNLAKKGRAALLERASEKVAAEGMCASYTLMKNTMEGIRAKDGLFREDEYLTDTGEGSSDDIGRTRGSDYYLRGKE